MEISHPEGAELQHDVSPATWIRERLLPWGRELGTRVCAFVPEGFEAYVRIFHHAEELIGTERVRRRWADIAERTGRTMYPTVQFSRFGWSEGPNEGSLDRDEAASLVGVLRPFTTTPGDCWFAVWHGLGELSGGVGYLVFAAEGFRGSLRPKGLRGRFRRRRFERSNHLDPPPGIAEAPTFELPSREYYLYRGSIDVVPRFGFMPTSVQTPHIWWPDDRAWVVATEIDFDSTLVGCSRACADALLACDELEALEVSPDDRLDIDGDTLNTS